MGRRPSRVEASLDPTFTERRDMHRRLWVSVTMLVAGASLLVAASLASAAGNAPALKKGGIWRLGTTGASVQVDPQIAYITTAWWLEYATAAKLYNYPDKSGPAGAKLVPEVASNFKVSNNGRTYTFTIRKGFKFSDGKPVTAASFKYAINRVANHDLASPGSTFIVDPNGTNIVGAKAVNDGHGTSVSGVIAKGNKLTIRLTKGDGTFMAKITMPFFQATSTKLPLTKEVVNVSGPGDLPSAGPYTYSRNDVNQLTSIRQNKYWKKGPGRNRPRNLTGLDIQWNLNEQTAYTQVLANQLDEGPIPAAEVENVRNRFGVNKGRYWTQPVNCTGYLPFNMARPLFKTNTKLRQAINFAVSRKDYVDQAGLDAGQPWSHLFNPGVPGWVKTQPYPLKTPNIAKARKLAGNVSNKEINVWYRSSGTINPAQAQIVRRDLIRLGFKDENIHMKGFSGGEIYDAMGVKGNSADMGVNMGWCSDYPDPYDWINILLYGGAIQDENNVTYSYMNIKKWNKAMEKAAQLTGPKRLKVYGKMDIDITKQVAPMAVERTYNNRYLFSNRVNPKSLVYQGIYQDWSIPAMALK
jgi:ABC-type transport system substrate-binding protein